MDIRKLQRAIVDGLEDVKAQDILVLNTEHLSALFERVIIASGTSNRQTKALASSVRESVKAAGLPVLATEGGDNGEWIIVDCGAAVAHIMQPAIRDYYRLEEIWGGKPVRMKVGATAGKGLVKASEPDEDDEDDEPPAKKPARRAAGSAAVAPAPGRKAAGAKSAGVKAAASKPSGTKAAGTKAAGAKSAGQRAPARPASTRAPAPTPPAAKRTAARKTAAAAPAKRAAAPAKKAATRRPGVSAAPVQTVVVKPVDRRRPAAKTGPAAGKTGRAPAKTGRAAPAKKSPARKAAPGRKTAARRG